MRGKLEGANATPDAFPILPEVLQLADLMIEILNTGPSHPKHSRAEREKLVQGLGRIITEDLGFAETEECTEMLQIAEEFIQDKG